MGHNFVAREPRSATYTYHNACMFVCMLDDYMVPLIDELNPNACYFQHHNAAPYRSNGTKEYFMEQRLMVTD